MSDKAKGKQRAEPIALDALAPRSTLSAPAQDYSPNIKFSIRFTDGAQDLRLDLPTTKRVAALVEAVGPSPCWRVYTVSYFADTRTKTRPLPEEIETHSWRKESCTDTSA